MNDNEFWITVWKIIAITVCVITVSVGGCTANRQYQTRALIENAKVPPMQAKCAIEGEVLQHAPCILVSVNK